VNSVVELAHILTNGGSANAGVALGSHVVSQGHDDLLDLLGQLAGRGQNQSLTIPQFGVNLLKNYLLKTVS
jgi:hypothetical protein